MNTTFEDFLMDVHAEQFEGIGDHMPDDYPEWISLLEIDEVIEYADKFIML